MEISFEAEVSFLWFKALVTDLQEKEGRRKFLLRFEDSEETWNSLRKLKWRASEKPKVAKGIKDIEVADETVADVTGFVHSFEMEEDFLLFCDSLHRRREELGDKTRGDCAYGEALSGGLISVLIRREALPEPEREVYNRFSVLKNRNRCKTAFLPLSTECSRQKCSSQSSLTE